MTDRIKPLTDLADDIPAAVGRRDFLGLMAAGLVAAGYPGRSFAAGKTPSAPVQDPTRSLLDQNENQLGPGPAARQAIEDAIDLANRYPDGEGRLLTRLAAYHEVDEDCLLPGCGSTEHLKICADAATGPHLELIQGSPTYPTLARYARVNSARVQEVPCDDAGCLDLAGMEAVMGGRTGCVYLCNPNNPTGGVLPDRDLRAFIELIPDSALVVVDEAYHDYVDDPAYRTLIPLALARPNTVVLRTFSKAFGLAGMRLGYALARPDTIERLRPFRLSIDLNTPAILAGLAALDDRAFLAESIRVNAASRARLLSEMPRFGARPVPSQAGFVWCDFGRPTAGLRRALYERGVQIRTYSHSPNHLRISTGTEADMDRLFAALNEVIG